MTAKKKPALFGMIECPSPLSSRAINEVKQAHRAGKALPHGAKYQSFSVASSAGIHRPPPDRPFVFNPPVSLSDILMLVFCGIVLAIVSGVAGAILARVC